MSSFLVFISYSRDGGTEMAEKLYNWIQNEIGFPVFFDTSSIKYGHTWKSLITHSLDSCFAVIVLLSESSVKSVYVTYEWSYAMGRNKKIIPLIIDEKLNKGDIPDFLR